MVDLVTKFQAREVRSLEVPKDEPNVIIVYDKLTANQPRVIDHEGLREKRLPKVSKAQFTIAPILVAKTDITIPKPNNCSTGIFGFIIMPIITKRFQRSVSVIP